MVCAGAGIVSTSAKIASRRNGGHIVGGPDGTETMRTRAEGEGVSGRWAEGNSVHRMKRNMLAFIKVEFETKVRGKRLKSVEKTGC